MSSIVRIDSWLTLPCLCNVAFECSKYPLYLLQQGDSRAFGRHGVDGAAASGTQGDEGDGRGEAVAMAATVAMAVTVAMARGGGWPHGSTGDRET